MTNEYGTPECRIVCDCKRQVETMLIAIGALSETSKIERYLMHIYDELEGLHEKEKVSRFTSV